MDSETSSFQTLLVTYMATKYVSTGHRTITLIDYSGKAMDRKALNRWKSPLMRSFTVLYLNDDVVVTAKHHVASAMMNHLKRKCKSSLYIRGC